MSKKIILSAEAIAALEAELADLKNVKRIEIAERLKVAIEFGDLSENAEYQEARDYQAQIELRISELEDTIKNAEVIKDQGESKKVSIGSKVKIARISAEGEEAPEEFTLVGSMEADVFNKAISNESPVGSALMGKIKGSLAEGRAPSGTFKYRIVDVK